MKGLQGIALVADMTLALTTTLDRIVRYFRNDEHVSHNEVMCRAHPCRGTPFAQAPSL